MKYTLTEEEVTLTPEQLRDERYSSLARFMEILISDRCNVKPQAFLLLQLPVGATASLGAPLSEVEAVVQQLSLKPFGTITNNCVTFVCQMASTVLKHWPPGADLTEYMRHHPAAKRERVISDALDYQQKWRQL
jgi:hypothetical protein